MKILVLFAALFISHHAKGLNRFRSADWIFQGIGWVEARWPKQPWLELVYVMGISILGGALISAAAYGLGGELLWAVLAIVVLLFTLGPRDLEDDIEEALDSTTGSAALGIAPEDDAHHAGIQIYLAALSRWFGVLVWFVVLGIPGALLYRITERVCDEAGDGRDRQWVFRLRFFLEWPVLVLMMASSALTNDFDRVYQAWHRYRRTSNEAMGVTQTGSIWMIHRSLLGELSEAVLPEGLDQRGGIQLIHHFVWRMLILWLVTLSILLLAGWLA
jgi:AmpE protein